MKPTKWLEHPEGGRFCEVFRSVEPVRTELGAERRALTHIYFHLGQNEVSRFHRVNSDEVWNLYQGSGLYLYLWDGVSTAAERVALSATERAFCHVVPRGIWQAAAPIEDEVLVGCSVAPGFEFCDFEMMGRDTDEAKQLRAIDPRLEKLIKPYGSQ